MRRATDRGAAAARAARVARARSRLRSRHRRRSARRARLHGDRHRRVAGDGRRGAPPRAAGRPARIASPSITSASTALDVMPLAVRRRRVLELRPAELRRRPRSAPRRSIGAAPAARRPARRVGHRPRLPVGDRAVRVARRSRPASACGLSRASVPVPLNGHVVWTRYYTPGEFERPFQSRRVPARLAAGARPARAAAVPAGVRRTPSRRSCARSERVDDAVGGVAGAAQRRRSFSRRAEKGRM